MDVLAAVAASLWVVVVMKLAIPAWLRGLSASACFFSLVVVAVAMSMSNATISQLATSRSLYFADDGSLDQRLVLGHTPRSLVTLKVSDDRAIVEVSDHPASLVVLGTQSVIDYLESRRRREP